MLFSFSKLTQQLEIVALAVEAKTITEVEKFKMLNKRNAIIPWIARTTVATISKQKAKTRHCLGQIGQKDEQQNNLEREGIAG